jgi:hypothetical protein
MKGSYKAFKECLDASQDLALPKSHKQDLQEAGLNVVSMYCKKLNKTELSEFS